MLYVMLRNAVTQQHHIPENCKRNILVFFVFSKFLYSSLTLLYVVKIVETKPSRC